MVISDNGVDCLSKAMTTTSDTKSQRMFALVDQWRASAATNNAFCDDWEMNIHTFSYFVTKRRLVNYGGPTGGL